MKSSKECKEIENNESVAGELDMSELDKVAGGDPEASTGANPYYNANENLTCSFPKLEPS